jgi:hypothetical protein
MRACVVRYEMERARRFPKAAITWRLINVFRRCGWKMHSAENNTAYHGITGVRGQRIKTLILVSSAWRRYIDAEKLSEGPLQAAKCFEVLARLTPITDLLSYGSKPGRCACCSSSAGVQAKVVMEALHEIVNGKTTTDVLFLPETS